MKLNQTFVFIITLLAAITRNLYASADPQEGSLYYDADEVSVDSGSGTITAQGHVFFLLGNSYIAAEKIVYFKSKRIITAEGNVRLIRNTERIFASRIVLDENTREARMDNVKIVADPTGSSNDAPKEIFEFTPAELAFEVSRSERTREIELELYSLRDKYVSLKNIKKVSRGKRDDQDAELKRVQQRYPLLLERLSRTRYQPNIILNDFSPDYRQRLERRRNAAKLFAEKNPAAALQVAGLQKVPGFIRVEATHLYQTPDGNYLIEDAEITPCNCGEGGIPLWGFSSKSAFVEPENYVTLYGSSIDILTAPIIYSPIIKYPIKTKRQTGLLLPSAFASRSGDVFSQPLFITLGDHADATIIYNSISKRGNRFDLEGRVQLQPESRIRLYTEYISDPEYSKEYNLNKERVENSLGALKASPEGLSKSQEHDLSSQIGTNRNSRWYFQGSWNVPIGPSASAKAEGDLMSDNRYLSDFDKATATTQDLFVFQQSARRFMSQEVATEYYGDDFVLSARAQGERDLFAARTSETPMRLPRVELNLLPKRYFDLPFAFENSLQWERVHRLGGTNFVDLKPSDSVLPNATVPPGIKDEYDGIREVSEPYVAGERTFAQTRVTLPLPANDYLTASVSARGVLSQYKFSQTDFNPKQTPLQSYVSYESAVNMPFYSLLKIPHVDRTPDLTVRHDLTPGLNFKFVPEVRRDKLFPRPYHLFYDADNVVSTQEIEVYLTSDWMVTHDTLESSAEKIHRIDPARDDGVANQKIFLKILEEKGLSIEKTPEAIFDLSSKNTSQALYQIWAMKELNGYEDAVRESEFGRPFVWPEQQFYRQSVLWTAKPLSFLIKTNYNFRAEKTASEKNELLGPKDKKNLPEKWGDITAQMNWSLSPLLPLSGSAAGIWRRPWNRFREATVGISGTFPYGFSAEFSNSYKVTDDKVNPDNSTGYNTDRILATDLSYQPYKWLRFGYQKQLNLKPTRADEGELEYSGLQKISFLNVQDCLDITLQRFKDRDIRERYATWSIGLNLTFLGQHRDLPNIGDSLDRQIKLRNARFDPSTPKE